MGLFGLSKASALARARATGQKDLSMTLLEFLPHFTPCARTGIRNKRGEGARWGGFKNKCSMAEKLSLSSYSGPFPRNCS